MPPPVMPRIPRGTARGEGRSGAADRLDVVRVGRWCGGSCAGRAGCAEAGRRRRASPGPPEHPWSESRDVSRLGGLPAREQRPRWRARPHRRLPSGRRVAPSSGGSDRCAGARRQRRSPAAAGTTAGPARPRCPHGGPVPPGCNLGVGGSSIRLGFVEVAEDRVERAGHDRQAGSPSGRTGRSSGSVSRRWR